jgi:hypothetical protein
MVFVLGRQRGFNAAPTGRSESPPKYPAGASFGFWKAVHFRSSPIACQTMPGGHRRARLASADDREPLRASMSRVDSHL